MSVQNVLQGILSQKVVADGGGYSVKNDIVNVDTVNAIGVNLASASTQAGTISISNGSTASLTVTGVTTTSIVVVTPKLNPSASYWVTTTANTITITTSATTTTTFNYYVAKY